MVRFVLFDAGVHISLVTSHNEALLLNTSQGMQECCISVLCLKIEEVAQAADMPLSLSEELSFVATALSVPLNTGAIGVLMLV